MTSFLRVLEYRLKTRLNRGQGFSLGAALTAVGIATCSNDIGCAVYGGPCVQSDSDRCEQWSGGAAGAAGAAGVAGGGGVGLAPHLGGNTSTAGTTPGGNGGAASAAGSTTGGTSNGGNPVSAGAGGASLGGAGGEGGSSGADTDENAGNGGAGGGP